MRHEGDGDMKCTLRWSCEYCGGMDVGGMGQTYTTDTESDWMGTHGELWARSQVS